MYKRQIVKRAENGMIYDPVTIKRGSTVRDALDIMAEYKIGGIPVSYTHLSEVQSACGLNGNSCHPFFFLMIGMGVLVVSQKLSARYTSDTLTEKSNISHYSLSLIHI